MEPRSEVQYRPQTVINQWLSETSDGSDQWIVSQMMDGHILKSVKVPTYEQAVSIKQQWENSGDC